MILKVRHPAVIKVYCIVRNSRSGCSQMQGNHWFKVVMEYVRKNSLVNMAKVKPGEGKRLHLCCHKFSFSLRE